MTEPASVAPRHFFALSWGTLVPPLALVLFAALPILLLRWTLYALMAAPLMPIIQQIGWVYRDKPMFLTTPAALFAVVVWAMFLYFFLCTLRHLFATSSMKPRESSNQAMERTATHRFFQTCLSITAAASFFSSRVFCLV